MVSRSGRLGVKLKLIPIPREIMEKKRTTPPLFLEIAVLESEWVIGHTFRNAYRCAINSSTVSPMSRAI